MTSTFEDRTLLSTDVAIKAPCRAATTGAITLSGEQTIDGIACVTGDRVLVKNQGSGADNGIYLASTGDWTRASDFRGNRAAADGTLMFVRSGATSQLSIYELSCATSPAVIGTTALTFNLVSVVVGNAGSFTTLTASSTLTGAQLTLTNANSRIVPGATSLALRNNADGADNITISDGGTVTIQRANLILSAFTKILFSAATGKLVGGGTGFSLRNNGDNADNLLIADAGAVTGRTTITATTGMAVGAATAGAGGVAFPAVQVAVADANTLDDYEEGTWTPSLGGSATYTVQTGTYTKVGRVVHIMGQVTVNVIGTGSTTTISGLPFTPTVSGVVQVVVGASSATNVVSAEGLLISGFGTISIFSRTAAAAGDSSNAIFGNSTNVYVNGSYTV
jgi:hypothetical protein